MTNAVGYKKPPKHKRWRKGESGNPTGRRKGQRNLKTDLLEELSEIEIHSMRDSAQVAER